MTKEHHNPWLHPAGEGGEERSEPAATMGIVEDDAVTSLILSEQARRHGFRPLLMSNGAEVRQRCAMAQGKPPWDILVLDLGLPDCDGLDLLKELEREHPEIPCVVLTARDRAADAVSAIRSGAIEYAVKPFEPEGFFQLARAAYDRSRLEQAMPGSGSPAWCGLGFPWKSKAMISVGEMFRHAVATRSPVLIEGKPGVGRYALARRIHSSGPGGKRSELAEVECGSLEEVSLNLMISGGEVVTPGLQEIHTRKRGLFSRSLPSTLLLRGIESLPAVCQATLCNAMESGTGNCRVIAVTGLPFDELIAREDSSHDLLYLLAAVRIAIPGLRLRREDLTPLFDKVLSDVCVRLGIRRPDLTRHAWAWVKDHHWPGNIAELKWVLNTIMARGPVLEIDSKELEERSAAWLSDREAGGQSSEGRRLDDLARVALIEALKLSGGNRRRVAAKLGVSLRTVYNMLERHGLKGRL
jgi:two-component system response regulator AtoC